MLAEHTDGRGIISRSFHMSNTERRKRRIIASISCGMTAISESWCHCEFQREMNWIKFVSKTTILNSGLLRTRRSPSWHASASVTKADEAADNHLAEAVRKEPLAFRSTTPAELLLETTGEHTAWGQFIAWFTGRPSGASGLMRRTTPWTSDWCSWSSHFFCNKRGNRKKKDFSNKKWMEMNWLKPTTTFQDFTQMQQGHTMNKSSVARFLSYHWTKKQEVEGRKKFVIRP
jgi:hypothetical protein